MNRLGGVKKVEIVEAACDSLSRKANGTHSPLRDGRGAGRIINVVENCLTQRDSIFDVNGS
jgi:hypothetical protein